jgi:glycosyltransferase involved in cell wall biosynthesis
MNDKLTVSIFLPTFCRFAGGYLERSILSVLNQRYADFELLVVDDGSVDGSQDLIKRFSSMDSRVIHLRSQINYGLPALSTGFAYKSSKGKYLCFIFDDCEYRPYHLTTLLNYLQINSEFGMAYGKAISHRTKEENDIVGMPYNDEEMLRGNNHIPNVSVIIRREVIEKVGWYDPNIIMKRFCDWDLWVRIKKDYQIGFVDEVLADEYGASLSNSLGNTFTLYSKILDYARTDRRKSLLPCNFSKYDPYNVFYKNDLSNEDREELLFLLLEHFVKTYDFKRLISYSESKHLDKICKPYINTKLLNHRSNIKSEGLNRLMRQVYGYYEKRLAEIVREKNETANALKINYQRLQKVIDENVQLRQTNQNLQIECEKKNLQIELINSEKLANDIELEKAEIELEKARLKNAELSCKASEIEFNLKQVLQSESWKLTSPIRAVMHNVKKLKTLKTKKKVVILAVSDAVIPPVQLGIILPFNRLKETGQIDYEFCSPTEVTAEKISGCDIFFCMRSCSVLSIELLRSARNFGKRVVYALDDDLESIEENSLLGQQLKSTGAWDNVKISCQLSHKVFVFSEGLYDKLKQYSQNVVIMPALCNIELLEGMKNKKLEKRYSNTNQLVIGYAASHHHAKNFAIVKDVIRKILKDFSNITRFEIFFGLHPTGLEDLQNFVCLQPVEGNIEQFYETLLQRQWDIGIAPLVDNAFNQSKSNNKYREYGALGIAGIYSDVKAYSRYIRNFDNGILVTNSFQSWYDGIIFMLTHPKERLAIAESAKADVKEKYSMGTVINEYIKEFLSIAL